MAWAAWALLTYEIGAKLLPGTNTRVDVYELLRTIGFASAPGMLRIIGVVPALTRPIFFLTAVWMLLAMIVAVRQALDYAYGPRGRGVRHRLGAHAGNHSDARAVRHAELSLGRRCHRRKPSIALKNILVATDFGHTAAAALARMAASWRASTRDVFTSSTPLTICSGATRSTCRRDC